MFEKRHKSVKDMILAILGDLQFNPDLEVVYEDNPFTRMLGYRCGETYHHVSLPDFRTSTLALPDVFVRREQREAFANYLMGYHKKGQLNLPLIEGIWNDGQRAAFREFLCSTP